MKQRLQNGDAAPDFTVKDVKGKTVGLKNQKAPYVLLTFMRYSGCPYCNLAIHRLAMEYPMLQKNNCEVICFVQSQKQDIERNIYDRHTLTPPFHIVADPAMHVYEDYGVSTSVTAALRDIKNLPYWVHSVRHHGFKQTSINGSLFVVPAYFLIETRSQRVIQAHYGSSFYEHETFTRIYQPLLFSERA